MTTKNNLKFLFILSFISLFGCTQEKEQNNQNEETLQENQNNIQKDSKNIENQDSTTTSKELEAHQAQFVEAYRKSEKTASITDFKKENNYKNLYLTKLSELTNLNHEQVCQISAKFGLYEVEKIVKAMPQSEKAIEAKRLTTLMRLNRLSLSKEAKDYLESKKNPSLSSQKQTDVYLSVYEEAALLHTDVDQKLKLDKKTYPKSNQLAQLTQLDFKKLATIESQLGLLGLRSAIMNIPNFPQKDKALEIISK